jgi:uncharacterized membrane protein YfcA
MNQIVLVPLAGFVAGAMNAAAGGGSFVSVPALIYSGVPSVSANMSSTIALYPGAMTSAWAYRKNIRPILGVSVKALFLTSMTGGFAGGLLLLLTPTSAFDKILPWLLLVGALIFAFGPKIGDRLQRFYRPNTTFLLIAQFFLGIYGGYFGGAIGIMMMAVWSILGLRDIKAMNATKVVLVAAANTIAIVCFILVGPIAWGKTLIMMLTGAIGGYLGARLAMWIQPAVLRMGLSIVNFAMVAVFFYSRYF